MNTPNKLTVARCIMALIFVAVMSIEHVACYALAFVLFVAAALTDYFDGQIARRYNLVTNFGKLLDPVADKVLMLAGLVMLMTIPELRIPGWAVVVIFAREFLVTGARSLAAAQGAVLAANKYGKTKTTLQMGYVILFLLLATGLKLADTPPVDLSAYLGYASRTAIIIVAIYTVYSGIQFARTNWRNLHLGGEL